MKGSAGKNLTGCCGLYCGLCSKHQSNAPSRCIGCRVGEQHSWCSIWNCCVKKRGFTTCAECSEVFECEIFLRRKVAEWIPAADNLRRIKRDGPAVWLREQMERQTLLEGLLHHYNEGRSMSFYCKACARMPVGLIQKAAEESKEKSVGDKMNKPDIRSKARWLKEALKRLASEAKIDLT
jgi:hypothetical protein